MLGEPGCAGDCAPVVDVGPVVWVLGVVVGGEAAVLGPVAGGGVIDEFGCGVVVFVSAAVVGGPAAWCESSCNASASSSCRLAGGA